MCLALNTIKNMDKAEIGKLGEELANIYLIKNDYKVIYRNYRRKSDEIDIIAKSKDEILVFFEVKTMTRMMGYGQALLPEDNLTGAKFRKILRTCEFFARKYPALINEEKGWRMDLLAVDLSPNGRLLAIRHYENI